MNYNLAIQQDNSLSNTALTREILEEEVGGLEADLLGYEDPSRCYAAVVKRRYDALAQGRYRLSSVFAALL
jgi:hypothetical protein